MPALSLKSARPATLRVAFEPSIEAAREASVAVRSFLAEQGMPEKEIFSYELCIAEACYNAIEYADTAVRSGKPVAEALFTEELIELRVTDFTPGFDLAPRIPLPAPDSERGRGLFLIQTVMDEVLYFRGSSENQLVMRKKRVATEAIASKHELGSVQQLAEAKEALDKLNSVLEMRSEVLSAVFRCCAEMGRGEETSEGFGERLLKDLLHLTSTDWYVLRLFSSEGRQLAVASASSPELALGPIDISSGSYEAMVAVSGNPIRFTIRECSNPAEPLIAVGADGMGLAHPLRFGGILVGTLAVGRRDRNFKLGLLQEEVIRAFAEFLAIQTLNLRHRSEVVQNRVVAKEFEIARDIQRLLLPPTLPQLGGFGLAGAWHSAREVGGDFYDAIALEDQSLLLMMADVMGKGVPAALFATTLRGLLRGLALRSADPAHLLSSLNQLLCNELSAVSMFITVQIVHVNFTTRTITAAGAGHCPLLIVHPGRRGVSALTTQGLPIGVLQESYYANVVESFGAPATVLMHTDGLTDSRDISSKMYGQKRLMAWMRANATPTRKASEIRDLLVIEMERFRGSAEMSDDQAFLVLSEEPGGDPPQGTS
jgi:serine phosphatase RsbU (regulator of sigma subunit)/anti-sigma regulatory factor (Ser/Thr protein kinase)